MRFNILFSMLIEYKIANKGIAQRKAAGKIFFFEFPK
jgi:hypothetical protein